MNLGMRREEFMRTSPRFFAKLVKEYEAHQKRSAAMLEFMLAQLTAVVANTGFKGWEEARKPEEFMPSEWAKKKPEKPERMTKAKRLKIAEDWRMYWKAAAGIKT